MKNKQLKIEIEPNKHAQLKSLASLQQKKIKTVLTELIDQYINQHEKQHKN